MARLNRIWWYNTISFASKFSPYKSLVTSILFYGCEAWTLLTDTKKQKTRTRAFETKCIRKLLRISYLEHKTNDCVKSKISFLVGSQEPLLTTVKRRKLHGLGMLDAKTASPKPFFRAPWRASDAVVGRGNAGWTTSKSGHICPCQNCSHRASCRKDWKRIFAESSLMSP